MKCGNIKKAYLAASLFYILKPIFFLFLHPGRAISKCSMAFIREPACRQTGSQLAKRATWG
jgi:hypothetical protein